MSDVCGAAVCIIFGGFDSQGEHQAPGTIRIWYGHAYQRTLKTHKEEKMTYGYQFECPHCGHKAILGEESLVSRGDGTACLSCPGCGKREDEPVEEAETTEEADEGEE